MLVIYLFYGYLCTDFIAKVSELWESICGAVKCGEAGLATDPL